MTKKQKLELVWIGKENRPRLEPRILLEDPSLSYHASHRFTPNDRFANRLIFGDNLLALKALEQEFTGRVKCIYIDPPFNTQQTFEHYDDGVEHSLWLAMLRDRLDQLSRLLEKSGTVWLHLDDNESHRARCVMDEVFGSENFLGTVIWEKSDSPRMDADFFSSRHDYLIVYAKDRPSATFNRLGSDEDGTPSHYDKVDEAGRSYYLKPLRAMGGQGETREARPTLYYPLQAPDGTSVMPKRQDGTDGAWRWSKSKVEQDAARIQWIKGRKGWTPYYRIFEDKSVGRPPETIWPHSEVGSNRTSRAETKALFEDNPFSTPKPERLLKRVLEIATNPGDLVVDSFAGSGTTGAVAHKMGRRWIMVELGEHCHTHIIPRLKKVIDGEDPGGITDAAGWKGGGGYRYFRLAPSLLCKDQWGNLVVNKEYNAAMLAEAMCKLEGFTYAPSATDYWQHGNSTERDFIYVTTQKLTREQLAVLSEEVGDDRSLLVCCAAFRTKSDAFPNLTIKKIPNAVLARCEWGHDDYSLQIKNLPSAPDLLPGDELPPGRRKTKGKAAPASMPLFDTGDDQ
jgi:adenine-specific DNA-methyltransferase